MYINLNLNTEQIQEAIKFLERELLQEGKWDTNQELECEVLFLEAIEVAKED